MGYYCTVPQCTSLAGKTKNVKFHRFPRDVTMADKWNLILKRGKPYTKYSKVCSLHFTQADYNVTTMGQWKTLSKDAIPSQNLPKLKPDGTLMVIRKSRTVKYREGRLHSQSEKSDKWTPPTSQAAPVNGAIIVHSDQDPNAPYRLQTLSAIASALPPQLPTQMFVKPKKQDAFMQTDPVASEDDDLTQPNNSYSEASETSFNSEQLDYQKDCLNKNYDYKEKDYDQYKADDKFETRKYEIQKEYTPEPQDYTKQEDYIPQTNEEYNKEAEKYALERKSLSSYDKQLDYQKPDYQKPDYQKPDYQKPDYQKPDYQKPDYQKHDYPKHDYQKVPIENGYQMLPDYMGYYQDSVEMLRNQQHNLEILQQQHRINENLNFFNENHIKQEVDLNSEEEKFLYERTKDQLEVSPMYGGRGPALGTGGGVSVGGQRLLEHLQHQLKQEPAIACDEVMQPQGSPYYGPDGHNNGTAGGYYDQRPGPELLIAKQNALAAHTQLWQNTMKRPFFYSETPHYSALHRYEDLSRILQ